MKTIAEQLLVFNNSPILLGVSKNKTLRSHPPLAPEIASFWTPLPSNVWLPSEGFGYFLDLTLHWKQKYLLETCVTIILSRFTLYSLNLSL